MSAGSSSAGDRVGPEDGRGAGLEHAREALGHPRPQLARGLDHDLVADDLDESEGRQPDLVHVRLDPLPELAFDASPGVVWVVGHGHAGTALRTEDARQNDRTGAAEAAGVATISGLP